MKILVAVKRVIDPYVKIRIKSDHTGIETQQVKMSINPFDEIALEEAIRLKEKNIATEVVVVSIGAETCQESLRNALALGADKAILVRSDNYLCSLNIAKILRSIVGKEQPHLVLLGKQSIDGDNNQTPQMLASLLNWPQATYASEIMVQGERVEVTREVDGGLETLAMNWPAVISTDLRLNEPRYASLPNIMKAKHKPLEVIELEDLALDLKEHIKVEEIMPPPKRNTGVKLTSVEELISKLKQEVKVLE